MLDPLQHRLIPENIQRGIGRRTGQRVCHISGAMHKSLVRIIGQKRTVNSVRCHRRRHSHSPGGQGLAQTDNIRRYSGLFAGKHGSCAAKSGKYFIQNKQNTLFYTLCGNSSQCLGTMKFHTPRPLYQRFHNHTCNLIPVFRKKCAEFKNLLRRFRQRAQELLLQESAESFMHTGRITADRHGRRGVAVIAGLKADKAVTAFFPKV